MSITRPRGEQIVFSSSKTGEHSLDTYLESAEIGNKTINELLTQLYTDSGLVRSDLFEFREYPPLSGQLQVRFGDQLDPDTLWANVTSTDFQAFITACQTAQGLAETAQGLSETAQAASETAKAASDVVQAWIVNAQSEIAVMCYVILGILHKLHQRLNLSHNLREH